MLEHLTVPILNRYLLSYKLSITGLDKKCCGLAARSRQIDRQRDTCEFVCLPSQGGQSVLSRACDPGNSN
jgi:hypothetical protein